MADSRKILIIDDEPDVHYSFRRLLQNEPFEILTASSGDLGIKMARQHEPDLVVMDIRMGPINGLETLKELRQHLPKQVVIMMTAYGTSQTAIEAMKLGAYDYVLKPFDIPQLKQLLRQALEAAHAQKNTVPIRITPHDTQQTIVGSSPPMQELYKVISQVAPTPATVLITGESGTGKELVARAISQNSLRAAKPFLAINCAAIPENLLESELFGHEKGTFTGALTQRVGKFEQCDGGTLFLDEIGDMPLATQAKILRVLQEGEISRLGSNTSIKTDVRIVAATNKDLWQAVGKKEFREDLYFRLNVVRLQLPPLRDRLSDVPALVTFFMNKFRLKHPGAPSQIAPAALEALQRYPWPGNVRELENCIQRALVLATGSTIQVQHLPAEVNQTSQRSVDSAPPFSPTPTPHSPTTPVELSPPQEIAPSSITLDQAIAALFVVAEKNKQLALLPYTERELIVRAMARVDGNQVKAAKLLGITRATLRKRIEKFSIQKKLEIE